MKKLANLKGAKELDKNERKNIKGGGNGGYNCPGPVLIGDNCCVGGYAPVYCQGVLIDQIPCE
ncbi:MAG TPA: hypothetical protein ENK46_01465 [Flavobacteriia bacterium]|jgi:hypothetical protein|nr:hypothetical protein [Flavobacteriia bacterium]